MARSKTSNERRHTMSTKTWINANYDKVLRGDYTLVNMEIDRLKAENEQLSNKVSELTEALDGINVFCEGANERFIMKAREWISNELMRNQSYDEFATVDMIKFVEDFEQAMKGIV